MTYLPVQDPLPNLIVNEVKSKLEKNIDENNERSKEVVLYFEDCFSIDKSNLPSNIDILFYDAEHGAESQSKALPYFLSNMNTTFLYVVDDANWSDVYRGTMEGLEQVKDKIVVLKNWQISGASKNDDPIWHNGLMIFLCSKIISE